MRTRVCIVGGGPAGMMLGFLLARAGIDVAVLEKHGDFLRDFRGDTIHPSTLELFHELGLLDDFLRQPHQEARQLGVEIGGEVATLVDFSRLPTRCKFLALMPQWDFLNFLAERGQRLPTFHLHVRTEMTDLLYAEPGGRVSGVRAKTPGGELLVQADLVVGCDGRHATTRERAGLTTLDLGSPMDVFWMRVSKGKEDPVKTLGHVAPGRIVITIDRGDYWQCAYVIAKGSADAVRARGLAAFREDLARIAPFLRERVGELDDWDKIKLLTVAVDRLQEWHRPGLLCIGDAAHAMSPIGGIGINLAIQDAVAAANLLCAPLQAGTTLTTEHMRAVQDRRELPTRLTQGMQIFIQNRLIRRVLAAGSSPDQAGTRRLTMPWLLRLLDRFTWLQQFPARIVGLGFRPEHVGTPQAQPAGGGLV